VTGEKHGGDERETDHHKKLGAAGWGWKGCNLLLGKSIAEGRGLKNRILIGEESKALGVRGKGCE